MSAPNQVLSNYVTSSSLPNGSYYSDQFVQAIVTLVPNTGTDAPLVTMQFHKYGNKITLRLIGGDNTPGQGAGVTSYSVAAGAVPAAFRPTVNGTMIFASIQGAVKTLTYVDIAANGSILVYPFGTATFVAASHITGGVQDYFLD